MGTRHGEDEPGERLPELSLLAEENGIKTIAFRPYAGGTGFPMERVRNIAVGEDGGELLEKNATIEKVFFWSASARRREGATGGAEGAI